uniref:Uncharacterized protein n=1 Tax=Anguilla anguilla TaxID=7936 RepID=A0A0E9SDP6_ANGAN
MNSWIQEFWLKNFIINERLPDYIKTKLGWIHSLLFLSSGTMSVSIH